MKMTSKLRAIKLLFQKGLIEKISDVQYLGTEEGSHVFLHNNWLVIHVDLVVNKIKVENLRF